MSKDDDKKALTVKPMIDAYREMKVPRSWYASIGAKGGKATTDAKVKAARENGRKANKKRKKDEK